jgi:hypothetical protein
VGLGHLLLPLLSVCVSLSAGLLGGALMSMALHHQVHLRLATLLGAWGGRSMGGSAAPGAATVYRWVLWIGCVCVCGGGGGIAQRGRCASACLKAKPVA